MAVLDHSGADRRATSSLAVCRLSANLCRLCVDSYHLIGNHASSDQLAFWFIGILSVEPPVILLWFLFYSQSVCKSDRRVTVLAAFFLLDVIGNWMHFF